MAIRFFTIAYDPEERQFEDQDFQEFCHTHSACILQTAFFIHEGRPWWSLCVSYRPMEQQKPLSEIATKKEPQVFFEEGSHQKGTFNNTSSGIES